MILMERMDGDLRHLIEQRDSKPFANDVAIDIIFQIATGMAYLHNQGVFHGDLKASNVLVIHRGGHIEVKIADFGVSQSVQLTRRRGTRLQKDGMYSNSSFSGTVGTTCWRAPEVFPLQVSNTFQTQIIGYLGGEDWVIWLLSRLQLPWLLYLTMLLL
jgi:serine/threonine protein kinase